MPATYHEQPVTILRPVIPNEPAFDPSIGEQVLIRTSEGIECIVPKDDLDDGAKMASAPNGLKKDVFGVKKTLAKSKATAKKKKAR